MAYHIVNVLELIGTFMLAIEAIKIPNIIKFKEKLITINSTLNPKIEWVDDDLQNNTRSIESSQKSGNPILKIIIALMIINGFSYIVILKIAKYDLLGFFLLEILIQSISLKLFLLFL